MNLLDYYSAGYYLIRAGRPDWPQWDENPLLPKKALSLSECITRTFQIYWGWNNKEDYRDDALAFGFSEDKLSDFYKWAETNFIDFPGIFPSVANAQAFIKDFELPHDDLYLVGLGLHRDLEKFWHEREMFHWPDGQPMERVSRWILRQTTLEAGGTALGYEVVSIFSGQFSHSWFCSGVEKKAHELFGIRPNSLGLIEQYEDAKKVYKWIEDEKGGEPEPYDAWLFMSYPLSE
jgi:hypothetical protein